MVKFLFLIIVFFFLFILVMGLSLVRMFKRILFGDNKQSTSHATSSHSYNEQQAYGEAEPKNRSKHHSPHKIFAADEGEYVEYEEIK